MKVRALRGVCIGVERHLLPGDVDDVDPALVTFLVNIKAVELVVDAPPPAAAEPEHESTESEVKLPKGKKEKHSHAE